MKGKLRIKDDGWQLEAADGEILKSGDGKVWQTHEFISHSQKLIFEHAAETVEVNSREVVTFDSISDVVSLLTHQKPYDVIDERSYDS